MKYVALLLLILTDHVIAETEYQDNSAMTNEEISVIRELSSEYEYCMNEYASSQLAQQKNIRVIADHSMKHCAPVLEQLYNKLMDDGFSPEFGKKFVSGISNRSANKLLSNLMVYTASQRQ